MYDKHLLETVTFHGPGDLARILDLRSASGVELVWMEVRGSIANLLWRSRANAAADAMVQILSIMPVIDPVATGLDVSDAYKAKTYDRIREILRAKLLAPITGDA